MQVDDDEYEALKLDALRYRWLRMQAGQLRPLASVVFWKDNDWANVADGTMMDDAIAARAALGKEWK